MNCCDRSPDTLIKAIRPMTYLLRVAGLSPAFNIESEADIKPYDSYYKALSAGNMWAIRSRRRYRRQFRAYSFYSLFICILLILCFALSQYYKLSLALRIPTTFIIFDWVTSLLSLLTSLCFIARLTSQRHKMAQVLSKLASIDSNLLNDPLAVYGRIYHMGLLQVFGVFILTVILTTMDFLDRRQTLGEKRALLLYSTHPVQFIMDLGLIQFIDMIILLKQRYNVLNGLLKDFAKTVDKARSEHAHPFSFKLEIDRLSQVDLPIMDLFKSLRSLRKIHYSLTKLARRINIVHGLPLLLHLLNLFLNITFLLYVSIVNGKNHSQFLSKVAWTIHHACAAVLLTSACHVTCDAAGRATSLVHKCLLVEALPPALAREMDRFSKQLVDLKVEFTAHGCFRIDLGLLSALAGATATYLLILIRFHDNEGQ